MSSPDNQHQCPCASCKKSRDSNNKSNVDEVYVVDVYNEPKHKGVKSYHYKKRFSVL